MDMTPSGRVAHAEQVVREQRDPSGEYCVLDVIPDGIVEAMLQQELRRLQAAVMGEQS